MDIEALIRLAESDYKSFLSGIEEFAGSTGMSVREVSDLFAKTVAERFCLGEYSFHYADGAINALYSWAYGATDNCLSTFGWEVYLAFDEGEYLHEGAAPGEDGEPRTRRLLRGVVSACWD